MAQAREPFDWSNQRNLRRRALESVKEFFGKEERSHPLSPEKVAEASKEGSGEGADLNPRPREERKARETENDRINKAPNNIWPG